MLPRQPLENPSREHKRNTLHHRGRNVHLTAEAVQRCSTFLTYGVILSAAVFQAERRISGSPGLAREPGRTLALAPTLSNAVTRSLLKHLLRVIAAPALWVLP